MFGTSFSTLKNNLFSTTLFIVDLKFIYIYILIFCLAVVG